MTKEEKEKLESFVRALIWYVDGPTPEEAMRVRDLGCELIRLLTEEE